LCLPFEIKSTVRYLGVKVDGAIEITEKIASDP